MKHFPALIMPLTHSASYVTAFTLPDDMFTAAKGHWGLPLTTVLYYDVHYTASNF